MIIHQQEIECGYTQINDFCDFLQQKNIAIPNFQL